MSKLADALQGQATACAALGSPFMARLLTLLAQRLTPDGPVAKRLFDWPGDISPAVASVPLRLTGALHAQALADPDGPLAQSYPPNEVSDDQLWDAVMHVFATQTVTLMSWLDSPPQTNEVRRSAVLIATTSYLAEKLGPDFVLSELGASAGLNLMFDRFALQVSGQTFGASDPVLTLTPDWQGPLPPPQGFSVADRGGTDINPLDPTDAEDQMRLRAYLWPDQPHRRALTDAAISCAEAKVDAASAETWLKDRLTQTHPKSTHLIYHTVAWQYFPDAIQRECAALIEAAGAKATADAPLAWMAMENDADPNQTGAALTLRYWPGDHHVDLGRADFHGRWVRWNPVTRN